MTNRILPQPSPLRSAEDVQPAAALTLSQTLAEECQQVLQATQELLRVCGEAGLARLESQLQGLQSRYRAYEGALLDASSRDPLNWEAWKLIQELAVLMDGFEHSLRFRRQTLTGCVRRVVRS